MDQIITTGVLIYGKKNDETNEIIELCQRLCLKYQFKETSRDDVLVIANKNKYHGSEEFLKFIQAKYRVL